MSIEAGTCQLSILTAYWSDHLQVRGMQLLPKDGGEAKGEDIPEGEGECQSRRQESRLH